MGLINYYGKFICNLSTLLQSLNALVQTGTGSSWSTKCEKEFQEAKKQIAYAKALTHYDPTLPIKLVADVSAYGIGVVISHRMPDGTERPIAFASRTLTAGERTTPIYKRRFCLCYMGSRNSTNFLTIGNLLYSQINQ